VMRRGLLISTAMIMLAVVVAVAFMLFRGGQQGGWAQRTSLQPATNLALDIRYSYDPAVLTLVDTPQNADYPLRLDGDDWCFYGKRIRGIRQWLDNDAGSQFYDFVSYLNLESYESWYGLETIGDILYEDTTIGGRLAVHQQLTYRRSSASRGWPSFFPKSVTSASNGDNNLRNSAESPDVGSSLVVSDGLETAYLEAWSLFSDNDLFFFQAVSPQRLTSEQRDGIQALLNSIEFDVLLTPSGGSVSGDVDGKPEP